MIERNLNALVYVDIIGQIKITGKNINYCIEQLYQATQQIYHFRLCLSKPILKKLKWGASSWVLTSVVPRTCRYTSAYLTLKSRESSQYSYSKLHPCFPPWILEPKTGKKSHHQLLSASFEYFSNPPSSLKLKLFELSLVRTLLLG